MRLTAEVMQAAGSCIMSTLSESSNRGGIGVGTCLALGVLRMNAWSENQCPEQHIVHLSPKLHIQKCDAKINGGGGGGATAPSAPWFLRLWQAKNLIP